MSAAATRTEWAQRILLLCGILAPLVHLGTDGLAGRILRGYSRAAQSLSELSAAGNGARDSAVRPDREAFNPKSRGTGRRPLRRGLAAAPDDCVDGRKGNIEVVGLQGSPNLRELHPAG